MKLLVDLNWEDWHQLKATGKFVLREDDFLRQLYDTENFADRAIISAQLISSRMLKRLLSPAKKQIFEPGFLHIETRKYDDIEPFMNYNPSDKIVLVKVDVPDDQILAINAEVWDDFDIQVMDCVSKLIDAHNKMNIDQLMESVDKIFNVNIIDLFNLDEDGTTLYFIREVNLERVEFVQYMMNGNFVKIDHPNKWR